MRLSSDESISCEVGTTMITVNMAQLSIDLSVTRKRTRYSAFNLGTLTIPY